MTVALCGGVGGSGSDGSAKEQVFREFVAEALKDGGQNWPTSKENGNTARVEVKSKQNDNAKAVAKDLVALNRDEKTLVAGLLAKTIEGGEVVEMCLSLSTET
ncbi:hypothetical protein ANAPC1_01402 [Anaplasma phagocytophilum]|uniref:Uncharacterized protein n=1 Tax=Anaplasma phagocytophilum TaxID=948 RepID=A0AA45UUB3_ANAPH|nr:hypothetical protein [Anaplasma phagocytophilum]SBO15024.1 hypothetical protein ANAPC1_01402 [Anaplasma phagocytophilum]SBO30250.1 hypothetical protein ANAPC4_00140 [Anaplasma phagocytophilum]SBO30354.1 hypothetical protein ANAPC3_00178 [Anaplasma phagocytophilum]SBO30699.1 hypothetical protein ANAPC2_00358 [Anaplasma phagocytophilum]